MRDEKQTNIPMLSLQWSWLHTCVAFSCDTNHISVVVNGVKIVEKHFQRIEGRLCPNHLAGNLVLQKGFLTKGNWVQILGKVTNLNIFAGLLPMAEMVAKTSGESCVEQDGDFLSWANSSWSLQGGARWTDSPVKDICSKDSSIQLFTTQRVPKQTDCEQLCPKLHKEGRMASVETPEMFDKLRERLKSISNVLSGVNINVWLPLSKRNNTWVDSNTGNELSKPNWIPGHPRNDSSSQCAIFPLSAGALYNFRCHQTGGQGGLYCSCDFPEHRVVNFFVPSSRLILVSESVDRVSDLQAC